MPVLAATADIHSPRFLKLFSEAMEDYNGSPDAFILAGDIVDRNKIEYASPVVRLIRRRYPDTPIIAVFGNEEYRGFEDKYREKYPEIKWLDDEYVIIELGGERVAFIGTRGSLEKPTTWQARNMPWLVEYYRGLPSRIRRLAEEAATLKPDYIVLTTHYGVTHDTLVGEPRRIWPYLANPRMLEAVKGLVDAVIHGHAHNSSRTTSIYGTTRIYNVALPANKRIVEVALRPSGRGILSWLGK